MSTFRQTALVLAGVVIGACVQQVSPSIIASSARAAPARQCDYTYIKDTGDPNIGESGQIQYDAEWQRVLADGWKLQATVGYLYIFERCR